MRILRRTKPSKRLVLRQLLPMKDFNKATTFPSAGATLSTTTSVFTAASLASLVITASSSPAMWMSALIGRSNGGGESEVRWRGGGNWLLKHP
ncbi:hypothetical protein L195_g051660 [Trifolium pratense]|uniref:Uncharacterized protein n=1 Tax=Trifolium pratense TaxID=57577 RepID=A0A2K3K0W8_TRIPR|nr:hypothetical protein L195_g051660 [Trifolium pratense]